MGDHRQFDDVQLVDMTVLFSSSSFFSKKKKKDRRDARRHQIMCKTVQNNQQKTLKCEASGRQQVSTPPICVYDPLKKAAFIRHSG
jgi:hypothetical protein